MFYFLINNDYYFLLSLLVDLPVDVKDFKKLTF